MADSRGDSHLLQKTEIEELGEQTTSIMPEGLEKLLSEGEFVNLVAFLLAQTKRADE